MKITIEGTPEEIAAWARQVAGVTNAPCTLPHYSVPRAPVYPQPSWLYGVPGSVTATTVIATGHPDPEAPVGIYGVSS